MDLQRAFAEIAASAARLCDAYDADIFQVDGELLRRVAHHGPVAQFDALPLTRGAVAGRALIDRTVNIFGAVRQARTRERTFAMHLHDLLGDRKPRPVPPLALIFELSI
jgi:hypothetical protein